MLKILLRLWGKELKPDPQKQMIKSILDVKLQPLRVSYLLGRSFNRKRWSIGFLKGRVKRAIYQGNGSSPE
jgi:hypothetical protein